MLESSKILIIADYSALYAGNFVPSLVNLAETLKTEHNCEVVFSFPNLTKERYWIKFLQETYNVVFFSKNSYKEEVGSLTHEIKEISPDIVYFHFISDYLCYRVSKKFRDIKFYSHIHSDFNANRTLSFKQKIKQFIFEKILNRKITFIYVSKILFDHSKNKTKFYVKNALVNDRIIDKENSDKLIKSIKVKKDDYVFLTYGWSPFVKGIDITLKAFDEARKVNKNLKLIISCGREITPDKMKDYSLKFIDSLENIIYIEPVSDVFGLLNIANCFISSSRSEGFSYSILEALYANKFIIASDIDGTKWCGEFKNVRFFETENPSQLCKAMLDVINYKPIKLEKTNFEDFQIKIWTSRICNIMSL